MNHPFRYCVALCVTGVLSGLIGCSPTVREDRSINFSSEGKEVALQHGKDGVFVASTDGQSLQKIFDSSDALAVSSPLWSPIDQRLIFTSADAVEADGSKQVSAAMRWEADPEGRMFRPEPIVYTCWLREEAVGNEQSDPVPLFTAHCDHPGYVAANLAVRWHPDGDRILFVDQAETSPPPAGSNRAAISDQGVSLFEFDIESASKRSIPDYRANALIFDWSPSGKFLTCSLLGIKGNRSMDGVWVRTKDTASDAARNNDWWRVPESDWTLPVKTVAMLDRLRDTKPAWCEDDDHFAFSSVDESENQLVRRSIYRSSVSSRSVTRLHQTESTIRDLCWQPDSRSSKARDRAH